MNEYAKYIGKLVAIKNIIQGSEIIGFVSRIEDGDILCSDLIISMKKDNTLYLSWDAGMARTTIFYYPDEFSIREIDKREYPHLIKCIFEYKLVGKYV